MLNSDQSSRSDKFHPFVLKMCATSLAKPISTIFQKSFESGKFPKLWIGANVTPLFKKGSGSNPANYRPISLNNKRWNNGTSIKAQSHQQISTRICIYQALKRLLISHTRICNRAYTICNNLQADINNVVDGTKTWLMRLNLDKYKVIHSGKKKPKTIYIMQSYESNQRIQIQPTELRQKRTVLGMMNRTFVTRNKEIWKKLYTTYVRLHL